MSGLVRGRLAVGMVTACTVTGLFDALAALRLAHPGITITLAEADSASLIGRVRSGAADVALAATAGDSPPGLDALPITSEGLAAAVPPGHPLLARRPQARLADLAGYPIACLPEGTGIRGVLDQACAAQGLRLDIALEASAPGTVADLAARGLGVAVLSQSMAASHAPRLQALPIGDIAMPARLALIWKSPPSPALRAFLRHCRQAFAAPQPAPAIQ